LRFWAWFAALDFECVAFALIGVLYLVLRFVKRFGLRCDDAVGGVVFWLIAVGLRLWLFSGLVFWFACYVGEFIIVVFLLWWFYVFVLALGLFLFCVCDEFVV